MVNSYQPIHFIMKFILLINLFLISIIAYSQVPVKIKINNVRNTEGSIQIVAFKNAESYENDAPFVRKRFSKNKMKNGAFIATIELPAGIYGIAVLDDENKDKEMNYNFVGMPKEGYGFSHFYHTNLSKPKFSDFVFNLKNEPTTLLIKLRYF